MSELEVDLEGLEELVNELPHHNPNRPPTKDVNITLDDILTIVLTYSK